MGAKWATGLLIFCLRYVTFKNQFGFAMSKSKTPEIKNTRNQKRQKSKTPEIKNARNQKLQKSKRFPQVKIDSLQ